MLEAQQAIDLLLFHQIMLQRYSAGVVQRIMSILNKADQDIFARLQLALDDVPTGATGQVQYLQSILESVRSLNTAAYVTLQGAVQTDMAALAAVEVGFNSKLYGAMAGRVPLAAVSADAAYAAAMSRPFQGVLLREALPELGEARMRRVRDAVRIGFVAGKTSAQIVRELRGTKANNYQDGVIEVDRRHLETVVHSALGHTAATARNQFMEANKGVIGSQLWLSTIDGKTSQICMVRSGKRYTTGEKPKPIGHSIPWCAPSGCGAGRAHFRCRSTAIGLLKGQEAMYGVRASGDGPIDANTSYGDWLKRQPDFVQDEVLGAKRAKLFRDGGLTIDKFSTEKGNLISLEELRKKDSAAFERAGI